MCPVASVANLFSAIPHGSIYTTKNQGMIEKKSIKKDQIIEQLWVPLEEIRNVRHSEQRNKGHAPIRLPALPDRYHRLIPGGARQLMLAAWPARA